MTRTLQGAENHAEDPAEASSTPFSPTESLSSGTAVASSPNSHITFPYTPTRYDGKLDARDDVERPLQGWPELAKLIAKTPDFEAFEPFRDLHIKSILYYQAELILLREKIHQAEYEDSLLGEKNGVKHASNFAEDLQYLIESRNSGNPELHKQWTLIEEMRKVLKKYNAALLQYSQISALPQADPFNVESLRVWLKKIGDFPITGPGEMTWGDPVLPEEKRKPLKWQFYDLVFRLFFGFFYTPKPQKANLDLIMPCPGRKVDGFTRWVTKEFVPVWQSLCDAIRRLKKSDEETGSTVHRHALSGKKTKSLPGPPPPSSDPPIEESSKEQLTLNTYSQHKILRFTSAVATLIACLLPTAAIAVLAKLHTTADLLGVIAVFTAIFALGLMFLTDAGTSRAEIFTATAAFSAVMVVFVQNQNSLAPSTEAA